MLLVLQALLVVLCALLLWQGLLHPAFARPGAPGREATGPTRPAPPPRPGARRGKRARR